MTDDTFEEGSEDRFATSWPDQPKILGESRYQPMDHLRMTDNTRVISQNTLEQ